MKIDWTALGVVGVVSIVASVVFVLLLSLGVRFVSAAQVRTAGGTTGGTGATRGLGYAFLALAGLLVLFCLWLIVPQFH
ncbi:MAG: hypothetical protein JWP61_204 [Friedmanniella sp.]|nr:hypothetical protein [Friedmanniella sp.]